MEIKNEKTRRTIILRKANWYLSRYISYHKLSRYKRQLGLKLRRPEPIIGKYTRSCFIYFARSPKYVGFMMFGVDGKFLGISIPERVRARILEEKERLARG